MSDPEVLSELSFPSLSLSDLDVTSLGEEMTMVGLDEESIPDYEIQDLLRSIESDLFSDNEMAEMCAGMHLRLPPEMRENLNRVYNWNEHLLPELQYRCDVAFTELRDWDLLPLDEVAIPHWFIRIVDRVHTWIDYLTQYGVVLPEEGASILTELRGRGLFDLASAFERAYLYNSPVGCLASRSDAKTLRG